MNAVSTGIRHVNNYLRNVGFSSIARWLGSKRHGVIRFGPLRLHMATCQVDLTNASATPDPLAHQNGAVSMTFAPLLFSREPRSSQHATS